MSEHDLLIQMVRKLLARDCGPEVVSAAKGGWAAGLWSALEDAGVPLVGVPEDDGGVGGGWPAIAAVVREAARYAAPVPIAETLLARKLLAEAGLDVPSGPLTLAPTRLDDRIEVLARPTGFVLRGTARRVPWGRSVERVVVVAARGDGTVLAVVPRPLIGHHGTNLAAEPRDDLTFNEVALGDATRDGPSIQTVFLAGAVLRSAQLLGALERALELTVEYARIREQFGRPIGQFQAIQQECARFAAEVAAADASVGGAIAAMSGSDAFPEVAAAKIRVGSAASVGARIAHQVHGAVGVTEEHHLHHLTTRLWSWRDEFGSERHWSSRLGEAVASSGPDVLWDRLTRAEVH